MLIPPSIAAHLGVHRRAWGRVGARPVPNVEGSRRPTGSSASSAAPFDDWCASRAIHRLAPATWSPSGRQGDVWHVGCTNSAARLVSSDVWSVRRTGGVEADGSTDAWRAACTGHAALGRRPGVGQ
jgi:hypothetical protein